MELGGWHRGRTKCEIKQVLYADDILLGIETREHFQHIVNEFERACDNMGLKINDSKSKKVLVVKKNQSCEL